MTGCLSYSDKIVDGFYNIMGMDPYLWAMCNDMEEGRRLPSLAALRAINPEDAPLEVVVVDGNEDLRLKQLEDVALELYKGFGHTLDLVGKLAKLVSIFMG